MAVPNARETGFRILGFGVQGFRVLDLGFRFEGVGMVLRTS